MANVAGILGETLSLSDVTHSEDGLDGGNNFNNNFMKSII